MWFVSALRRNHLLFLLFVVDLISPLSIPPIHACCEHLDSSTELFHCVNTSLSASPSSSTNAKIALAVFASSNVWSYAAHTALVMSLYGQHKGYYYRILGPETGDDFSPDDRRWNKVMSTLRAFHPKKGWAKDFDALVYLDADLVVMDFSLSIEGYLISFPDADLIMSSDALDVGNTGFLIIRNTDWIRSFFASWWLQKDTKYTFCDQHVLNKLYEENKERIQILKQSELNSVWPALEHLESEDKVLHLMGEISSYRTAVFRRASGVVCRDILQDNSTPAIANLPKQLGFTRELLVSIAKESILQDRHDTLDACRRSPPLADTTDNLFQALHEATTHACDDRRSYLSGNKSECKQMFMEVYEANELKLKELLGGDPKSLQILAPSPAVLEKQIFLLNQMTKVRFDLIYFSTLDEVDVSIEEFHISLRRLSNSMDMSMESNQRYIQHKRAILFGSLAQFSFKHKLYGAAVNHALAATDEMSTVLSAMGDTDPDFSGFVMEYIDSVVTLSHAFREVGEVRDALNWADIALRNARELYKSYIGEKRLIAQRLGSLFLDVAKLQEISDDLEGSIKTIIDMKITIAAFDQILPRALSVEADALMVMIHGRQSHQHDC